MITSCIIFLATFGTPAEQTDQYYLDNYFNCQDNVPVSMWEHAPLYYQHFDEENLIAVGHRFQQATDFHTKQAQL